MKTLDGWSDTSIELPAGHWSNVLSGATVQGGVVELAEVFSAFPVALLIKGTDAQV